MLYYIERFYRQRLSALWGIYADNGIVLLKLYIAVSIYIILLCFKQMQKMKQKYSKYKTFLVLRIP